MYRSYQEYVRNCHVVIVDFCSAGVTLVKTGTQGDTFLRVLFMKLYTENWFKTGIESTDRAIPSGIPDERRRQLRLQLLQRFIFITFKELIRASYDGFVIDGCTYIQRISMFVEDQHEERMVLALKRLDSDMHCTHCILQSRHRNVQKLPQSLPISSFSDEDTTRQTRSRVSIRNQFGQLCTIHHKQRYHTVTVRYQISAAIDNIHRTIPSSELADVKNHLIGYCVHEFPPALSSFECLGFHPCNVYRIVSFDKLQLMDLGITRQLCYLKNTVLRRDYSITLSSLISIANSHYMNLPQSACL